MKSPLSTTYIICDNTEQKERRLCPTLATFFSASSISLPPPTPFPAGSLFRKNLSSPIPLFLMRCGLTTYTITNYPDGSAYLRVIPPPPLAHAPLCPKKKKCLQTVGNLRPSLAERLRMEVARDMMSVAGRTSDSPFKADAPQFSSIPTVPFRLPDGTEVRL